MSWPTRKRIARAVRNAIYWRFMPHWAEMVLRPLAFRIHPHVLKCKSCGAEFVQTAPWSKSHAHLAYGHYMAEHEAAS